jgi:hypothetical protein
MKAANPVRDSDVPATHIRQSFASLETIRTLVKKRRRIAAK